MSKPSYYELSQPEVLEVFIQNKQTEISQLKSNVSALQSLLASGPLDTNALLSTLQHYEKKRQDYIAKTEQLVTDRDNLKDPTKEQLDRINSEIDFYTEQKNRVTNDINQLELQRERSERALKKIQDLKENIVKLESELTELKKLKNLASYHQELYELIQGLDDPEVLLGKLTDPGGDSIFLPWVDDRDLSTNRFKLINGKTLEYFPRKRLRNIITTFENSLKTPSERVHTLYGTIGAGKSHILLAMACYYFRRRDRVIYFSKANDALKIENWKAKFMFLLYQESRKEQPDSSFIKATEKALAFIEKAPRIGEFLTELKEMNGKYLRIFIDQMNLIRDSNTIKHEKNNAVVVNPETTVAKLYFEALLDRSGALMVLSSSANDEDIYSDLESGSGFPRIYMPVLSGLTPVEYDKWFDRCEKKLEAAGVDANTRKNFTESKDKIEFLTRAAPLYLRLYFNLLKPTYDETVAEMKRHDDVKKIKSNIRQFYKEKLRNDDGTYRDYAFKCMTDTVLDDDAKDFVMRRYVYILGERIYDKKTEREGCISCEFVAEFIAEALRRNNLTINWSFDEEYLWELKSKKQLVAMLEEEGMKKILNVGLPSCGICHQKPTDIKYITQATQVSLVNQEGERVYYKALRHNFEAIDALYLTKTKIIGINFTINAKHTDPYCLFVEVLENIPNLRANLDKYEIYFVWMVTSNCTGKLFEPRTHTVDGVTFNITKEAFQMEVEKVHTTLAAEHKARMDKINKAAAESTNNVVNANPTVPKKPRVGNGRQVTPTEVKPEELGVQRDADLSIGETKPKRKLGSDNSPIEREISSGPESKRLRNSEENSNSSTEMEPSAEFVPILIEPGGGGKRISGGKKRKINNEDGNSAMALENSSRTRKKSKLDKT